MIVGSGRHPRNENVLCDVCEALIGAIFIDSDCETAVDFVNEHWKELIDKNVAPPKDAKTKLQEVSCSKNLGLPQYRIESREGSEHEPLFHVSAHLSNGLQTIGSGRAKSWPNRPRQPLCWSELGMTAKSEENLPTRWRLRCPHRSTECRKVHNHQRLCRFQGVYRVSPKCKRSRSLVRGIGIFENTQIIFIDTPGIFKPKRRLDRAMVASSWSGVTDADITVLVVDAKRGFDHETRSIIDQLNKNKQNAVLLINKVDLVAKEKLLALSAELNRYGNFAETFFVSAATRQYLDDFYRYLAEQLPVSPWFYPEDQISDMPLRILAAEITREKLFLCLHQELPYALTVETELWERRDDNSVRCEQTIYVERDNQKVIVLGKGGSMIKKIGANGPPGNWKNCLNAKFTSSFL